jgi:hypothetical protein
LNIKNGGSFGIDDAGTVVQYIRIGERGNTGIFKNIFMVKVAH